MNSTMLAVWLVMSAPACALYAAAAANRGAATANVAKFSWALLFASAATFATMFAPGLMEAVGALALMSMLTYLAVFDLKALAVPVWPTLSFTPPGLALALIQGDALEHALSAGGGWLAFRALDGFYRWARGRSGLGAGDALIAALIGAWVSWEGLVWSVACAGVLGLGWALLSRANRHEALPFAPALALGVGVFLIASGLSR